MHDTHITAASVSKAAEQARQQTEATAVALALSRARMEYILGAAASVHALPLDERWAASVKLSANAR